MYHIHSQYRDIMVRVGTRTVQYRVRVPGYRSPVTRVPVIVNYTVDLCVYFQYNVQQCSSTRVQYSTVQYDFLMIQ